MNTRFLSSPARIDQFIDNGSAVSPKRSLKTVKPTDPGTLSKTTRMKKLPVSVSSNCCASRMLKPPSNRAVETRATMPGRLAQDRVRTLRRAGMGVSVGGESDEVFVSGRRREGLAIPVKLNPRFVGFGDKKKLLAPCWRRSSEGAARRGRPLYSVRPPRAALE